MSRPEHHAADASGAPDDVERHRIAPIVNGRAMSLEIEPREALLDVLRERLELTGTKKVCAMGNCGACTVELDGEAVYSCLVLGVECDGREITTIEGLADGDELHPLQQAFIDRDAFQCGFCTCGQIMSLKSAVDTAGKDARTDEESIRRAMTGNLCRCGAYDHILAAARQAAGLDAGADTYVERDHVA